MENLYEMNKVKDSVKIIIFHTLRMWIREPLTSQSVSEELYICFYTLVVGRKPDSVESIAFLSTHLTVQFNSIQFICIAQFHKLQICFGVLYNLYT